MDCTVVEPYALQVLGESMSPEFPNGCVIIVEPASTAEPGQYVIAERDGETILGVYSLLGEQGRVEPLQVLDNDAQSGEPPVIRGRVIQRAQGRGLPRKHY